MGNRNAGGRTARGSRSSWGPGFSRRKRRCEAAHPRRTPGRAPAGADPSVHPPVRRTTRRWSPIGARG